MFTVIIPLYNKAESVGRSIESVLCQTFGKFEIVVVDDGSTDNGVEIVKSFHDKRIRLVTQGNAGVSAARNRGISIAKKTFVTFLDADDEYNSTHLETLNRLIVKYPNHNIYATSYKIRTEGCESNPQIQNLYLKNSDEGTDGVVKSFFHAAASKHMPVHLCSLAVRREIFCENLFPVGVKVGEDLYFISRIMIENDMVFSFSHTYTYNFEETNRIMMRHEKIDEYFDDLLKLGCKDKYLRAYVALWHTRRAVYAMRFNDMGTIFYHLMKSLRIKPLQIKLFKVLFYSIFKKWRCYKLTT